MATGQVPDARQDSVSDLAARSDQPSDGQLLDRYVKDRDEAAFTALVERYGSLVLGVCERILQDRHYAEDAFQATFMVLVRRADSLDGQRSLGNWLYAVAYRTALKAKAMAAKRRARERQALDMPAPQTETKNDYSDLRPVIDEALNELPEKYRAPLVLCCIQGKTHQEAALELGWPTGSMSRRMDRARKLLRKRLARRGITLSAGVVLASLIQKASAATVSSSLLTSTVKAAMLFGAGAATTAGAVSADVAALTDAVLKATAPHRWKIAALSSIAALLLVVAGWSTSVLLSDDVAIRVAGPARFTSYYQFHSTGPGGNLSGWVSRGTLGQSDLGDVTSVALSPSNALVASTSQAENWIRIWDVSTTQEQARLSGHTASIPVIAFSPDGKVIASGSEDSTVRLWNATAAREIATLRGHTAGVLAIAFSHDGGLLASAGLDDTVRVWDVSKRQTVQTFEGHFGPVFAVAFSPDGKKLVCAGKTGLAMVWDVATGSQVLKIEAHVSPISSVAIAPDGKVLATGGWDKAIRLWDLESGALLSALEGHADQVRSIAFSPSGHLVISAGKDKSVRVWQVSAGRELTCLQGHTGSVNCLALGRDGTTLATGSADQAIRIWWMDDSIQELK